MKTIPFLTTLGLMVAVTACASDGGPIDELNMGLSKTSVFDTPTPAASAYSDAKPGKNEWLPRAWEGAPPQVPHRTEMYLPVVAADNQPLVEKQTVTLSRDFVFNKDDILAKEREADLISGELQRDVVNLAMLRIAAAVK